nr:autotransporter outer membrane beta-barrel domain-containing protein [Achromobacter sp. MFA1 R4]
MTPARAQAVWGTGEIVPSLVQTPDWVIGGDLVVGDSSAGALTIENGGTVVNDWAYIGNLAGGVGTITVSGTDGSGNASTWTSSGGVYIGAQWGSIGSMLIQDGGVASGSFANIGTDNGSEGTVTVTGAGSAWTLSTPSAFTVGLSGRGTLVVANGAAVHSGQAIIGWDIGGDGRVSVTGPGTVWDPANNIYVGFDGTGDLSVRDGATVSTAGSSGPGAASTLYIGYGAGGIGTVTVSSTTADIASLGATDRVSVGVGGAGTLTIGKGGLVRAGSHTWIAIDSTATGTLNLQGDATGRGILETGSVIKGDGAANLYLDGGILRATRSTADFLVGFSTQAVGAEGAWFDTDTHDVGVNSAFSGTSSFNKLGAGILTLVADSSAFSGTAQVQAGTLQVDGALGGPVQVASGARLTGTGRVGSTVNRGTIAPGPRTGFGTLTIAGDYVADGGSLDIRTMLGDDNSPTDRLVITGGTAGATPVNVTNAAGSGAATQRGIQVVQVNGLSAGQFQLANPDYVIGGQPAIVAGAYGYVLQQEPSDGGWYLRSSLKDVTAPEPGGVPPVPGAEAPVVPSVPPGAGGTPGAEEPLLYQPGVPVYEAYANTLLLLSQPATLRQRVGNRHYDPADSKRDGAWMRLEGTGGQFKPSVSTTLGRQNMDGWKAQFGIDRNLFADQDASRLVAGLTMHYGSANTRASSTFGNGSIATTSYGVATTLTWYGKDGAYVDAQAQANLFDSDLRSNLAGKLKDGQAAHSYVLSVEAGKAFSLDEGFALVPQAQLSYVTAHFGSFDDTFGARIDSDKNNSLAGRLGLALDYKRSWRDGRGRSQQASYYGIVNLKHEFLDGSRMHVADVPVDSRLRRTWGGISIGMNHRHDERYDFYGEVAADADFAGSYALSAMAGIRIAF